MSLVLALLVVVFSMVVPRLMGTVSSRRLAYAADEVRAAFGKGRNTAMRSGETYQFLYLPESGVYTIVQQPTTLKSETAFDQAVSGLSLAGQVPNEYQFQQTALEVAQDGIAIQRLPTPISFLDAATAASLTPMAQAQDQSSDSCACVTFNPDGSTSNSTVWLANEDGEAIPVLLRGMTGLSVVGEPVVGVVPVQEGP